jgi:hypothetical protein
MTFDVHLPCPADVDPLFEGLSVRRRRQRASERDKRQQFHDDVFHGRSPLASIPLLDVRRLPQTTPSHFLLSGVQKL